jgi:chromosome segregation ATPase
MMAFRLTKAEVQQREEIAAALDAAGTTLNAAVETYNAACEEAWKDVLKAQTAYNQQVEVAQAFITEIHETRQSEFDDKSEKWQDGEAGQAVSGWLEQWEVELDEIEIDKPDGFDDLDLDAKDTFEQLPEAS